jgi:hypothetical protein
MPRPPSSSIFPLIVLVALSSVLLPACGDSSDPSPSAPAYGDAGAGGSAAGAGGSDAGAGGSDAGAAGESGAGGTTAISGSGEVREFLPGQGLPRPPVEGVTVCPHLPTPGNCATTDAGGAFTLTGLPASSNIGILLEKDGYMRTLRLAATPAKDFTGAGLLLDSAAIIQAYVEASGGSWPLTDKGAIVIAAVQPQGSNMVPAAGATFVLSGTTGLGPVYASAGETADPTLTSTTSSGFAKFVDVTPGMATVTVTLPGKTCVGPMDAWKGTSPGTLTFPVEAGTMIQTGAICR